jgi:2-oxoglutarate dehydrogenase E2 component (dihydrolipoamide succinyltransferase)
MDIIIPALGESITEVVLGRWTLATGAWIDKDAPLVEIESDKVTQELPSPAAGVVTITQPEGTECLVGDVIGAIDTEAARPESVAPASPADETPTQDAPTHDVTAETIAAQVPDRRQATSVARRLATDQGVELTELQGTGPSGRIQKSDVLGALATRATPTDDTAGLPTIAAESIARGVRRERMSKLRQRVAERLVLAQRTAAMLTTFNEIDMTEVIRLRKVHKEAFNDRYGVSLGFMSFFTTACVSALQAFPAVNAYIVDREIEYHDFVDMSIAVGTDRGLVVPIVRNADRLSFGEIETTIRSLALRAREGTLSIDDMTGGTFTITNGGVYGSMMSTPILNPPQSGILGLHRIQNRAVEDPDNPGQIVLRPMMYVAVSYDHRIVDGADAVQFLVHIRECIEHPERLLLGL